jgi:ApbE superfamily uncharacterized protein (UPF0280 family)
MEGMGEKVYRDLVSLHGLATFRVTVGETDLLVSAEKPYEKETRDAVIQYRGVLETYIAAHPDFSDSLDPLQDAPRAPRIVREMIHASQKCGVGPMAGVAGAMAEFVGEDLHAYSREVIIENGGDIYIRSLERRQVAIYAGRSALSMRLGITIDPERTPLGVCTSSGTVGHSRSFGKADAVCILSPSATLADAVATTVGNRVSSKADIDDGLRLARQIEGVQGALIIVGDAFGAWGEIELVRI